MESLEGCGPTDPAGDDHNLQPDGDGRTGEARL